MTAAEIKDKLLKCMEIDASDYEDDATIGSFFDEEELVDLKTTIGDEFNIDVESMDLETTLKEIVDVLYAHFNG